MHRDGRYAVWFRTSRGEGTAIVHLANGRISGGDSFFTYSGCCEVDGDRFSAAVAITRRVAGPPTLFGLDEVEVELAGRFNGRMASCSGTAKQAPGLPFEATLIPSEDQPPAPDRNRGGNSPDGSDGRHRARNLVVRGLSRV
ncbi:hypothetical protein LJR220_004232 [Bradyrhizobium sp. LjRoot220]|uniref:hypothetical protein n=1 Tax=Bradyrhizobium sp. LjRoot220 TaxID=3342284 RepID=UPI003ECDF42B